MASKVTSMRVPYLPITVEIPEKHLSLDLIALLNTGFNSDVIVPPSAVANGEPALLQNDIRLDDDSRITLPGYLGNVRVGDTTVGPVMCSSWATKPSSVSTSLPSFISPSATTARSPLSRRSQSLPWQRRL